MKKMYFNYILFLILTIIFFIMFVTGKYIYHPLFTLECLIGSFGLFLTMFLGIKDLRKFTKM